MIIKEAKFIKSSPKLISCPKPDKPEYAFVGRSNVGKSTLINMILGNKNMAKTSATPGKTRLINHFLVNSEWYLVDLPGYGYAKTSKKQRKEFVVLIEEYLRRRNTMVCLFLLVDCRLTPQKNDLQFIDWLGKNQIPFVICFTKADKLKDSQLTDNIENYKSKLLKSWEYLPEIFITSSISKQGKQEILSFIDKTIKLQ